MHKFFPQLRTSILQAQCEQTRTIATEAETDSAEDQPAYHFLVHPLKNCIYAGEQLSPQAPELQIPLLLHPQDFEALMALLRHEQSSSRTQGTLSMQSRLQALDGKSWIVCELKGHRLPAAYSELYGWHMQAYLPTKVREEENLEVVGEQVLTVLSHLYNAGLWQYYPAEETLEVDSSLQKLLQLDKRRLTIQEWLQYIHPDDVATLLKKVFSLQRKGGFFQLNVRYKSRSSRHYRYLTLSTGAFSLKEGVVCLTGICFDGTLQQRLLTKNLLNKAFLDQAQSLAHIGCFEWMPEVNRLEATAQLKKLSGLSKEEDFSLEYLQKRLSLEDFVLLQQSYQNLLRGEPIQELTIRFRDDSGTLLTLWVKARATYEHARMVSLFGIVQNISERQRPQGQLQAKDQLIGGFLKNLPVCIMAFNKKHQIISLIGSGLKHIGLDRKSLIGEKASDKLPEFVAPLHNVFQGLSNSFVVERSQEGSPGMSLFNHFYYDAARELAVGFCLDISKQKQAERALQHLDQLEHRYQLMDTFVYAVAHDLRSPVVNLDMLLSFFTQDSSPEEQSKYVAAMTNGIQHLKRTLDALIEILRIEKDSAIVAEDIEFKQLIQELEQEYGEKLKVEGGNLHTYLQCEQIRYNRAYLSSILRNLISNAIKYRYSDRPPHLSICTEKKGNVVLLLVQDNGMGMDLKKWGHLLFKPFKRLNNHQKGTGIGLHLVKQIIEKNGGKIKVKSVPGEGTTFFCFLRPYR